MPIILTTFAEFIEKQGMTPIQVGNSYLFENGARSNGEHGHSEPPRDGPQRWELQVQYYDRLIATKRGRGREITEYVSSQTVMFRRGCGPAPEPGWAPALRKLHAEVMDATNKRNALIEKLDALPGSYANRARWAAEQKRELHSQADSITSELMNLPSF